jgi:lipoyl-dependent peroxiredoxin
MVSNTVELNALRYTAIQAHVKFPLDAHVTATVGIGPRSEEGGFGLEIALAVSLPGLEQSEAVALVQKAHQVCPYSNATRNNIDVKLSIVGIG